MISLAMTQIWVHDQDVAKEFYTTKLGWEVRQDAVIPSLAGSASSPSAHPPSPT
jgi:catechol 2,3-dioxygenase-like lactoylglutathione lyase family enzyme